MIDVSKVMDQHKAITTSHLSSANDIVTVYFPAQRSGSDTGFDAFMGESVDSTNPGSTGPGMTDITPDPVVVSGGKMHMDIAGMGLSSEEAIAQTEIGRFVKSDIMFSCLTESVLIDSSDVKRGTIFDICDYVIADKDMQHYKVDGVVFSGLGGSYLANVFMRRTNE
jgi:hypothetical protein